ncbi:MAG: SRPBCC family protein [Blastochloris sp.]|nr:SRPBCC family protein [Blastochloris sp.]
MVEILNVHTRDLLASQEQVAALMASLASADDRLWSHQWWPPMRFDRPLAVGAVGGHGPIRYVVESYVSGERIVFRFTAPRGFHGTHAYYIDTVDETRTRLRHVLKMRITGPALLSWPLVFRPLHDALIEDSLNVAEANLQNREPTPRHWSWWVRFLRGVLRRTQRRP